MELTEIATRELTRWHLAEEEKTSSFLCGENPSNPRKTAFSQSRRKELLPHRIPAWRPHVWGDECGQSRSQLVDRPFPLVEGGPVVQGCSGSAQEI